MMNARHDSSHPGRLDELGAALTVLCSIGTLVGAVGLASAERDRANFALATAESTSTGLESRSDPGITLGILVPEVEPCFQPHDGVGCGDVTCTQYVCVLDDFCCETSWDEECVRWSHEICLGCGLGGLYGDFQDDGVVDVNDLVAILANWGLPGCTDLDGSGTTDAGDLAIVTGQLFEVVPSSGG